MLWRPAACGTTPCATRSPTCASPRSRSTHRTSPLPCCTAKRSRHPPSSAAPGSPAAPSSRAPEQAPEAILPSALGRHHAVEVHHVVGEHEVEEALADAAQPHAQRQLRADVEHVLRPVLAALGHDGLAEQLVLVAEVAVQR